MTSSERFKGLHPLAARSPTLDEPARPPNAYARFIPREEVGEVTAWQPGSFGGPERRTADRRKAADPTPPAAAPSADDAERARQLALAVEAARQAGYRDGYRDGLVALESFKQSYAQQVSAQVAGVVVACQSQLDALQTSIAESVTQAAVALARQVVRHELATRPDLVSVVAREAVESILESARQLSLRVHPDDAALVAAGAGEALSARGVRVVADAAVERGGCVVDADIARLDASLAARWQRAMAQLGVAAAWHEAAPAMAPGAAGAATRSPADGEATRSAAHTGAPHPAADDPPVSDQL
ncbi:MAG: FliH/SctL family protein [Ideonella sp.]|jgi:flagellar assembly protein FliH|nr:FliH/SctL family protein [Ideonella sp.]